MVMVDERTLGNVSLSDAHRGIRTLAVAVLIVFFRKESRDYLLSHFLPPCFRRLVSLERSYRCRYSGNLPFISLWEGGTGIFFRTFKYISLLLQAHPINYSNIRGILDIRYDFSDLPALLGLTFLIRRRAYIHLTPLWLALPTFVYLQARKYPRIIPGCFGDLYLLFGQPSSSYRYFPLPYCTNSSRTDFRKTLVRPAVFSACFCTLLILPALPTTVHVFSSLQKTKSACGYRKRFRVIFLTKISCSSTAYLPEIHFQ